MQKSSGLKPTQPPIHDLLAGKVRRAEKGRGAATLVIRLGLTVLVMVILLGVVGGAARVRGESMEPTLRDGNVVLLYRLGKARKGDIVVLRRGVERTELVKRVVAVGGDELRLDGEGRLLVNGERETYSVFRGVTQPKENGVSFPYRVPEGRVFLMGDNREAARDSRELGAVPTRDIIGVVITIVGRQ